MLRLLTVSTSDPHIDTAITFLTGFAHKFANPLVNKLLYCLTAAQPEVHLVIFKRQIVIRCYYFLLVYDHGGEPQAPSLIVGNFVTVFNIDHLLVRNGN